MDWLFTPESLVSLLTLTLLEIVLGIDNIIFISILSSRLPNEQQRKARHVGLGLALLTRILLLCGIAWVARLDRPFWETILFGLKISLSWRDVVLILGGLFLLAKSTYEIHEKLEGEEADKSGRAAPTFASIVVQILLLDIVFSLDSVITAVGMTSRVPIMIIAVVLAMIVMLVFVNQIGAFVDRHPTIKMLALAFLILIGCMLVAEGFHQHIPKGYIYFAMAFAIGVEMLNLRVRSRQTKPVSLHRPYR